MSQKADRFDVTGQLPTLRRYALVLTHDPAEAEDLVHEALLRAYEKRASFRSEAAIRPWLLSILHNCFIDGIRRKRSEQATLAITSRLSADHQPPPQEDSVRLGQLKQRFMALPEEQRAALHLVAIEDLSYQEAAATLGIPVGTLMSRLGRARKALRELENASLADEAAPLPKQSKPKLKLVGGSDDPSA